jgi:hypothetical protein
MGNGPGPAEMLEIELIVREHVVAATAALNQPGGARAGLWQSRRQLANQ